MNDLAEKLGDKLLVVEQQKTITAQVNADDREAERVHEREIALIEDRSRERREATIKKIVPWVFVSIPLITGIAAWRSTADPTGLVIAVATLMITGLRELAQPRQERRHQPLPPPNDE